MPNTVPAAAEGLPNLNRRSALAKLGLGLAASSTLAVASAASAPIAGVLAVNSSDPVFDALAELQSVVARVKVIGHAHSVAEAAMIDGNPMVRSVEYEGREFRSVDQLYRAFEADGALSITVAFLL